jgi:hypothetical protein
MAFGGSIIGNLIVRVTADITGVTTGFAKLNTELEGLQLRSEEIGRAVQQECRDRYRMPSSA